VYVADATNGAALDAFTPNGALKWQTRITGGPELQTMSSPTVAPDGTVLLSTMSGPVNAIRPDGSIRWSAGADRYSSPAVRGDGMVFAMQVSTYSSHVDAFDANGSQTFRVSGLGFTESYFTYPVVGGDGSVYVAATGLFGLSATGTRRWSQPVASERPPAVGSDGTLYASGDSVIVEALDPNDGSRRWAYTEPSNWGTNYGGSVAVAADKTVYVGGDKVRVVSGAGALLRTIDVGSAILSALALDADGTVVFGARDKKVYAR
jgi:outer membrane protein assembly factor BamB